MSFKNNLHVIIVENKICLNVYLTLVSLLGQPQLKQTRKHQSKLDTNTNCFWVPFAYICHNLIHVHSSCHTENSLTELLSS